MPPMDTSFRITVHSSFAGFIEAGEKMLLGNVAGLEQYPSDTTLTEQYFIDLFREAAEAAEKKDVPLYCGEYGVIDNADPEDALFWFTKIHAAFEHYGIGRAAWSYRQMDFGLSDSRMDGVREELLRNL